jgi:c-di-GMP-binding flagellar brake protein YcgR
MVWQGFESRKFPRVKAECHIYIEESTEATPLETVTENVGAGGLCAILDKALPRFSHVKVRLNLRDGSEPIRCNARVVWSVERHEWKATQPSHDTGMEFIDLSPEERSRIEKFIA